MHYLFFILIIGLAAPNFTLEAAPLLFRCEELRLLPVKTTDEALSTAELAQWDAIIEQLMKDKPLEYGEDRRFLAYLYNAQNAFAEASFLLTGSYSGQIGPISRVIIRLFYPDFQSPISQETPFSTQLSNLIAKKFEARFQKEKEQLRSFNAEIKENTWKGSEPFVGITIPSKQLWVLSSVNELACNPPPSQKDTHFWQEQLNEVKKQVQNATDDQKKRILFWADSTPEPADILLIANKFMLKDSRLPLEKIFQARAMVASGMCDALTVTFICKYTYLIKRPFMLDPSFKTHIPTPNHPSYPSAHSTVCKTAAYLLSDLFPEKSSQWKALAEEAGHSRIWAGIHFPIDHQQGFMLGEQIAKSVLHQWHQPWDCQQLKPASI